MLHIGILQFTLEIPYAVSLKDKRSVSRRIVARLRQRFNVAVAEVGSQDAWTRLTLGVACVSNSERHAQSILDQAIDAIEQLSIDAELIDHRIELF